MGQLLREGLEKLMRMAHIAPLQYIDSGMIVSAI